MKFMLVHELDPVLQVDQNNEHKFPVSVVLIVFVLFWVVYASLRILFAPIWIWVACGRFCLFLVIFGPWWWLA